MPLLILQIIFNLSMFAGLYHITAVGWLDLIFAADPTGIVYITILLFFIGLALVLYQGFWIGIQFYLFTKDKGYFKNFAYTHVGYDALLFSKAQLVKRIAVTLYTLGLIGTVIGFIIIAQGISIETATTLDGVVATVTLLLKGLGVALYTTLVGAVTGLILDFNHTIIRMNAARIKVRLENEL